MTYNSNFIPIKPISVNSCFQGRRFRTTEFKKWQEAVIYSLPKNSSRAKTFSVSICVYLKNPLKSDIDNYAKPIIDCLVEAGVIRDDRYIFRLEMVKKKTLNKEGFEIEIIEIDFVEK